MKVLIFDSGPLINLSMNSLLYLLEDLKKNFDGKFIITSQVRFETIDKPMGIHRFELGALEIKKLLDTKIIELPSSLGISDESISAKTNELMEIANKSLQLNGNWINIVSPAEISCLALSSLLNEKNIETMIAIDERTTRTLCENPESLENLMENKMHHNLNKSGKDLEIFHNFRFIRSPEIVYAAYKKGLLRLEGKRALEAALYATKFKGSSISFEEIDELKKL